MADETIRCDKLEAQLTTLRAEFDRRTEMRDGEVGTLRDGLKDDIGELRDILTDLAARLAAVEKAADKSPSWINVFSALATAATIIAGLGWFALSQTVTPIADNVKEDRKQLDHFMGDMNGHIRMILDDMSDAQQRVATIEGKLHENDRINGKGD